MLIAHITDTHLVPQDQHWLNPATRVCERLQQVVEKLNALKPQPELLLITGDLADEGSTAAYSYFKDILQQLRMPYYVIPGNHDDPKCMRQTFSECSYLPRSGFLHYCIENYPLRLIGLDTHVSGQDYGLLCSERLDWCESILSQDKDRPCLIFMHHAPVAIKHKIFDQMLCFTEERFEKMVRSSPNLVGILAGHYHHMCSTTFGGKPCFIAPSVAPVHYFANPLEDEQPHSLELEDPAISLHRWCDSYLTTHVVRLKQNVERLDWATLKGEKSLIDRQ